ncbi:unnamed protein product [Calypogeia fissa]
MAAAAPTTAGAQFGTGVREEFSAEAGNVSKGPECKAKAAAVFEKFKIPLGLFPLSTISEFGYNESSGLFWMKQADRTQKELPEAEIIVHHHRTIHGYIEMNRIQKIVGLKLKDIKEKNLFVSMPYSEIKVDGEQVMILSEHANPKSVLASLFREK